jgi:hypothetical protein
MIYGVVVTGLKNFQVGSGSGRIRTVNNWPLDPDPKEIFTDPPHCSSAYEYGTYQLLENFSIWCLTCSPGTGYRYLLYGTTARVLFKSITVYVPTALDSWW